MGMKKPSPRGLGWCGCGIADCCQGFLRASDAQFSADVAWRRRFRPDLGLMSDPLRG